MEAELTVVPGEDVEEEALLPTLLVSEESFSGVVEETESMEPLAKRGRYDTDQQEEEGSISL
jgi:hypothetical protein